MKLFLCSRRGCYFTNRAGSRHDYTKLYDNRRRMFSIIIILSPCSFWDLKNMSERDTRLHILWPHTTCGESEATHAWQPSCPWSSDSLRSKLNQFSGNRTIISQGPDLLPGVSGWQFAECALLASLYYLPMTSKPRALTEAAPCYCCGARWLAVTTCVYPGPGPGPADVSSLRQLGDGRQGRGRARPEQAARAQQRPVGCDQGPGGDHCSYTQTPGADTVTSETVRPVTTLPPDVWQRQ